MSARAPGARTLRLALALGALVLGAPLAAQRSAGPVVADTLHPYHPGVDVVDYDLTLDLPESGRAIEGRAVLTVRRAPGADTLLLDLVALRVDSVLVDGRAVAFGRDEARLRVPLPAASKSDDVRGGNGIGVVSTERTHTVTVRYGGEVRDGLVITTDANQRWQAFGDNWPNRARHWIPSVDHPSDKATVTWTVRAPAERRVIANGRLVEERSLPPGGGGAAAGVGSRGEARTLTRWREERPIPPYLMVIAAAPLERYDLAPSACGRVERAPQGECLAQSVYVAPEVRDFLPGPFAHAADMVTFFSALIAPFPYEKLAHVQSATRFGGMENASAIFYADAPFRDRTMGTGVIAHEIAHQWFGDAVTEREWGHLWLSEGFASYFEKLWTGHAFGDSAFRAGMAAIRAEIVASPVTLERPVLDTAQRDYLKLLNTNSYQKGAWVLHMLRATVGDSAFFRGVRGYYQKHRHGTALTADLRREVEAASGRELGWFFDQWLSRPGVVEARARWRHDAGARRVELVVMQGGRYAPYRFPLTLDVVDAAGAAHRLRVEIPAQREARVTLPHLFDAAPARLVFDPDVELLGVVAASR